LSRSDGEARLGAVGHHAVEVCREDADVAFSGGVVLNGSPWVGLWSSPCSGAQRRAGTGEARCRRARSGVLGSGAKSQAGPTADADERFESS
jgi:hypothetical protein